MTLLNKRVLLSAFACDPVFGSDEEVGWQWAHQLSSRGFNVTVITRKTHQEEIERGIVATGQCASVQFEYVDMDWLYPLLRRVNRRNHIYYYFWQLAAFFQARKLHQEAAFSLIHHVTWVSFRQPSFMGFIGAPFFFGPVAGGDEIPRGYTNAFSLKQRLIELFRATANSIVRLDPLMRMTFNQAEKVFFTSEAHLRRVPAFVSGKAQVELAIGCDIQAAGKPDLANGVMRRRNRLLFAGRCIALKGMDIGLEILARIRRDRPDVTLTIVGDGEDRSRWMAKAEQLGLADAIDWRGWLSKAEVLAMYSEFDVLFYPSLRDSGGFVVLEALQQGLPVVCFKLGGPGMVVDDSCGKAVVADPDIQKTIAIYADSVLNLLACAENDPQLPTACRERAQSFTWGSLIRRIYGHS